MDKTAGYYEYKGRYFRFKNLRRDYGYLHNEEYNEFCWNIVAGMYNYLLSKNKLEMYNELTGLSTHQQNIIIMKSVVFPKPYKCIYNEHH